MMADHIYIQDCGIVTPLGAGKAEVARALFAGSLDGSAAHRDLLSGGSVPVGAVQDCLPPLPTALHDLDCRNNRLMSVTLSEIVPLRGAQDRCPHGDEHVRHSIG